MKHTIADARLALETAAPSLNPVMYGRLHAEIHEAEREAEGIANDYADERATHLRELRDEVLEEACELRDDYAALIAAGEQGTLTARGFHDRYERLEHRKRRIAQVRGELDSMVAAVERIEEDPIGWTDATFYAKYHQLTPEFSF